MEKFGEFESYAFYLGRINNTENFKKGIDGLISFRNMVAPYAAGLKDMLNKQILQIATTKDAAKLQPMQLLLHNKWNM